MLALDVSQARVTGRCGKKEPGDGVSGPHLQRYNPLVERNYDWVIGEQPCLFAL